MNSTKIWSRHEMLIVLHIRHSYYIQVTKNKFAKRLEFLNSLLFYLSKCLYHSSACQIFPCGRFAK